jgi:hypothetical protein
MPRICGIWAIYPRRPGARVKEVPAVEAPASTEATPNSGVDPADDGSLFPAERAIFFLIGFILLMGKIEELLQFKIRLTDGRTLALFSCKSTQTI